VVHVHQGKVLAGRSMANNAFLYTADRPDAWFHPEEGYDYSRWVIPLAWFFFRTSDIALADVTAWDDSTSWKEVRLSAEKDAAVRWFADRRPLLSALIAGRIEDPVIDRFLATIRGRPGRYLIMDPHEVLGDEEDVPFFVRVLEMIERDETQALKALDHDGSVVGGFRDGRQKYLGDVIGYIAGW
jgi:hypothetical protein